ncbi:MAG TPA: SDR family oxidoreductase [Tepidisphaeraceae bacterium]|jgi:NAD(P)-dependent dehydrogenase (short-subunit alcohol dehydrogenase family)|nr:SDR family oxidoreductase [Tepidisphaeraceae bacterium]
MKRLQDKVAIVSAAANGIGQAISQRFAEEGAWVLVTDIDEKAGAMTVQGIREQGGHAEFARVDIGSLEEIENAVKLVTDKFGRVDVLCNNAAYIGKWHDVLHGTDEEWEGCLNKTLLGTQRFTRAALPWMIKQKRGSVIITSSIQGMVALAESAAYTTVKAGLIGYGRSAARDYGKHNVRVNVICPGVIRVGYSPKPGEALYDYHVSNTFFGRQGETREVANAALFLASDEASYITGIVLPVDGGWTAM